MFAPPAALCTPALGSADLIWNNRGLLPVAGTHGTARARAHPCAYLVRLRAQAHVDVHGQRVQLLQGLHVGQQHDHHTALQGGMMRQRTHTSDSCTRLKHAYMRGNMRACIQKQLSTGGAPARCAHMYKVCGCGGLEVGCKSALGALQGVTPQTQRGIGADVVGSVGLLRHNPWHAAPKAGLMTSGDTVLCT